MIELCLASRIPRRRSASGLPVPPPPATWLMITEVGWSVEPPVPPWILGLFRCRLCQRHWCRPWRPRSKRCHPLPPVPVAAGAARARATGPGATMCRCPLVEAVPPVPPLPPFPPVPPVPVPPVPVPPVEPPVPVPPPFRCHRYQCRRFQCRPSKPMPPVPAVAAGAAGPARAGATGPTRTRATRTGAAGAVPTRGSAVRIAAQLGDDAIDRPPAACCWWNWDFGRARGDGGGDGGRDLSGAIRPWCFPG